MHPDYRKDLVKLLADTDQACAHLEPGHLTIEELEFAELAEVLRRQLLKMAERLEGRLRAEC
jgi:hypothetical protein